MQYRNSKSLKSKGNNMVWHLVQHRTTQSSISMQFKKRGVWEEVRGFDISAVCIRRKIFIVFLVLIIRITFTLKVLTEDITPVAI